MTHNATPKPQRPTRYPAHLAVMVPARMKAEIVTAAADSTQGEIVRRRLTLGRDLAEAYVANPELETAVERLRRESGVGMAEALATLLDFATREADRRSARNAKLALAVAQGFHDVTGIAPDFVEAGGTILKLE